MKNAIIYARVSAPEEGCSRQLADLRAFASRAGYEVVDEFAEAAGGTRNERNGRARAMALVQTRKIDAILVTEMTKWACSSIDLLKTLEQLAIWNVSLIAEKGMKFDLCTAQGKLLAKILSDLAEFEHDNITERTRCGLNAAVSRGKRLGRPTGNRTNEKHGPQVRELLRLGFSMDDIAAKLHISKSTVNAIKKLVR